MNSKRQQLQQWTTVVADTGDLEMIAALAPHDATTNPSLLLAAARDQRYRFLLDQARELAREMGNRDDLGWCCDAYACVAGQAVLEQIPGLVSTEVDARLSFDTVAMVEKARRLMALYRELGVDSSRVLIKTAATWEGIQAARTLEEEGIRCNLTLVFCLEQAVAAAEAGATLISPFVGRIQDWHVKRGLNIEHIDQDPGVESVRRIFHTLKSRGLETIVMGASFRNVEQIQALSGCDRLTISPALLEELASDDGQLTRRLDPAQVEPADSRITMNEAAFRWSLNDNPMATDLLSDGIRRFAADQIALEDLLSAEEIAA
ncbi:transaldolase [Alloalcanivorax mobilis]|uniref:transaldolase n=1 Tax=Alloalcanivorax mobilis TaxID=2019569 RepID=UPI000C78F921|nr:transaldolase [Alloalcanivorax mobilis]